MKSKIMTKLNSVKTEVTGMVAAAAVGMPMSAQAASDGGATSKVLSIAELVVDIFPLVGIFFVIAGSWKMFMAYKDNRPDDMNAAAKDIVIGAIFIVFRLFAWPTITKVIS